MPGYKVVLRILIVALILGGIGALIYFIVGGVTNTKTAHNVYTSVKNSNDYAYIQQNFSQSSDAYAVIDSNDAHFEKWYSCYKSQALIFNEFGETLYFSEKKVRREMSGKVDEYLQNLKNTKVAIENLLERKAYFDSQGITNYTQLEPLANIVKDNFYKQIKTLSSFNFYVIDFALETAIKNDASLKHTMLEILYAQANLLLDNLQNGNETNIALCFDENKDAFDSYNNQKEQNFRNQSIQGTNEFNMMLTYDTLRTDQKSAFLNSPDKQSFIAGHPSLATKLGYVMKVMGWES